MLKHEPVEAILIQTTTLSVSIYSNDVLFGAVIVVAAVILVVVIAWVRVSCQLQTLNKTLKF